MKKLIFILILLLLCSSKCKEQSDDLSYIFQRNYSELEQNCVIRDIDSLINVYDVQKYPLDEWITLKLEKEDGYIEQKMISKYLDSINYIMIYNRYLMTDTTFYELKIRKTIYSIK